MLRLMNETLRAAADGVVIVTTTRRAGETVAVLPGFRLVDPAIFRKLQDRGRFEPAGELGPWRLYQVRPRETPPGPAVKPHVRWDRAAQHEPNASKHPRDGRGWRA